MLRYFVIAIVIAFILYMCFKIFTSGADIQSSIDEKRKELEKTGFEMFSFSSSFSWYRFTCWCILYDKMFPRKYRSKF